MPRVSRSRAALYLGVVLVLLLLGGRFLLSAVATPAEPPGAEAAAQQLEIVGEPTTAADALPPARLVVHVVGAVRRPGVYRLGQRSRVEDAIRRAGGATPGAALALVNLAAPLADGQQVVVPRSTGSAGAPPVPGAPGVTGGSGAAPTGPVPLNTATIEQLDTLPGVGPVTAQRIVDYRTAHGAFQSVDELDAVPGIGPARLEQLRELVTV